MFRHYDQAGLDAQYNLRAKFPDFQDHFDRWERESAAVRRDLTCRLDVTYGEAAGETLDWFPAEQPGAPVHVFIHGGYWQFLDKKDFSFVAPPLVGAGQAVAVINYALAPAVTLDEIVRQVRDAIAWTFRNAKAMGGDPGRITVSGHSAGGHLTAMAMLTDWKGFGGIPADAVKAGCAISGLHDLEPIRLAYLNAGLNLSPEQVRRYSPIRHDPPTRAPLLLAVGGAETEEFTRQSSEFAARLREQGQPCQYLELAGHNHFTIMEELADARAPLTQALLKWIA